MPGVLLSLVLNDSDSGITLEQQERVIKTLGSYEAELAERDIRNTSIGCLYLDPEGRFTVGKRIPVIQLFDSSFRGPWASIQEFISAPALYWLRQFELDPNAWVKLYARYTKDVVDVDLMIDFYKLIVDLSARIEDGHSPHYGIVHADWDARNMLVDPDDFGRVTAILDWDHAEVRPAWLCDRDFNAIFSYSKDKSQYDALLNLKYDTFEALAPRTTELLKKYFHYNALTQAAWFPFYGGRGLECVLEYAELLHDYWPKDDVAGPQLIQAFLPKVRSGREGSLK